ncbi:hypothetical protein GEV33_003818 [Tenebrio molitor]|uniref:Uncharacterized protein n=1 Tax=Tenebrio molitor TaxID=7067 RepID=A0A8J6HSU2_TENMO|nr:hypothetical protein GEV33_003818 [Tenebrio molitor]
MASAVKQAMAYLRETREAYKKLVEEKRMLYQKVAKKERMMFQKLAKKENAKSNEIEMMSKQLAKTKAEKYTLETFHYVFVLPASFNTTALYHTSVDKFEKFWINSILID